jgi:hypothetical protein
MFGEIAMRTAKPRTFFYAVVLLFGLAIWRFEVHLERQSHVYGEEVTELNGVEKAQLDAFSSMNGLLTTLGTGLMGALGFLLARRRSSHQLRELIPAFLSFLLVGVSLYFGYHAYQDVLYMLDNETFNLTGGQVLFDREAHFLTFFAGVVVFIDFALLELGRGGAHARATSGE